MFPERATRAGPNASLFVSTIDGSIVGWDVKRWPMTTVWIVGAGAVGLGLGSFLLQSGTRVVFVGRERTCGLLSSDGLVRTGIFGRFAAPSDQFDVQTSLDLRETQLPNLLLICIKSYDSQTLARQLLETDWVRESGCPLVLCQNGWGNAEIFAKQFPRQRVFSARVITGFQRLAPNHVNVTVHAAPIRMGSLFGADASVLQPLCDRLAAGGIAAETTPTVVRDLWSKMLYNCCLNPLGAILAVPYGQLGEHESTRGIMDRIAAEVFQVMHSNGHSTHWDDVAGFLDAFYHQMLPPTRKHESSMLQDLRAGRRTEIDALCGEIVRLAESSRIETPTNRMLYDLIRFRTTGRC